MSHQFWTRLNELESTLQKMLARINDLSALQAEMTKRLDERKDISNKTLTKEDLRRG